VSARVLLVEDSSADAELVGRELRRALPGCAVHVVATRDELARALAGDRFDIVVSDHSLRSFSGREALDLARAADPDLPFILVTGSLDEDTAVEYMKAGAADYLLKDRLTRLGSAALGALEQARQRRALRRGERLLRHVLDTAPNMIFVRDREGRFALANRALADYYGTTPERMLGRHDTDFNPHTAEVEAFLSDDREVLDGRRTTSREVRVTDPRTGEPRWLQVIKSPLVLPGEAEPLVLGIVTDATERRSLEEQFHQAQKMEAVGRLAGGVAHDFNNILTAILGCADLLLDELPDGAPQREDAEQIREAGLRAAALTRQLLAFGRRESVEPVPLNVNAVVANVEKMLRRVIGEDIELVAKLDPAAGTVVADAGQLEQVIMNLVVNARDAMPDGGRLTIETANVELDADYAARHLAVTPGPHVMLAVTDTGVGIDDATLRRIFEPFFTTKPNGRGTGLGLATVYGIVKQNRGSIVVDSEPGRGSTFRVYLPRVAPPASAQPVRAEAPARGGHETVLVAEDDDDVRRLARRVLEGQGYAVLEAPDAATALRLAAGHAGPIDLLLTDVVMPEMPGTELARRLGDARPGTRVLYVSGYTDHSVGNGALPTGTSFLQKPFSATTLVRRVRHVLDAEPAAPR
jgi:two-component system cell cycle sensor histidine kinase/response regulator CckA